MKSVGGALALLIGLASTLLGAVPAQASTKISSCPYTITASGTYDVTQDLTCSGTAITITASKVDLHLNGHTLSGSGAGVGVFVQGQANVSIDNATVQGFFEGVEFQGTVDCKITNVTARQNSDAGIVSRGGTSGLTVTGCTAPQNVNHGILFDSDSRANTAAGNTANGNGSMGIYVTGGAFANTLNDNTTNQNGVWGIGIDGGGGNSVTGNTANQNHDRGITFYTSGNLVERNTCDRNGNLGIGVAGDSHNNTVVRNSATANGGQGIALFDQPTHNTVQDNTVSGSYQGIFVGNGPAQNTIQGNTATLNVLGILLTAGATGNTIQGNTALTNANFDVEDDNPGCDSNHWLNNRFVTFSVAGGSDGGCLLGQPNTAQLSVTANGNPGNLAPGDCITLALKVRVTGRSDYLDVTSWSETSFSAPGHGVMTGNKLCVGPADANTTFTVYGRYTDPVSGVFTTGSISVHVHK